MKDTELRPIEALRKLLQAGATLRISELEAKEPKYGPICGDLTHVSVVLLSTREAPHQKTPTRTSSFWFRPTHCL